MVAEGQHIQMKAFQSMAGIEGEILNVYYFEVFSLALPNALYNMRDEISEWYAEIFVQPILDIQTTGVTHTRLEVATIENWEVDFAVIDLPGGVIGANASNFTASSTAWSFQLVRQNRTTRNGSKRYAGVPEDAANNNVALPGIVPYLAAVEAMLGGPTDVPLVLGEVMTLLPVIAKTPVAPAKLPSVFNNVTGALYRGLGTQNTRKQLLS